MREIRTSPPLDVEASCCDVVKARQQGDTKIREAEGCARGATNKAVGEASAIRQDVLTRSNYFIRTPRKEAADFPSYRTKHQRNPELFTKRLLAETSTFGAERRSNLFVGDAVLGPGSPANRWLGTGVFSVAEPAGRRLWFRARSPARTAARSGRPHNLERSI